MTGSRLRRAVYRWAVLLVLLWSAVSWASAQERFRRVPPPPDPTLELRLPNIETVTLANGLALSAVYREGQPFINIQLLVQAGDADSPKELPAIASVTANLVPRGTVLLSAAQIEQQVESLGGSLTVTTYLDRSLFTFQCLEEYLDQALDLLSQMILQPSFSEVELGLVRYAMYYEIMEKERDPDFVARRQLLRELLRAHAFGRGYFNKSDLRNIKLADIARFFQTHYFPNRAHVILTGNISLRTAIRKVSHYFNTWARGPSAPLAPPLPQPRTAARVIFIDVPQSTGGTVYLGNVAPSMTSPDYFPLSVFHQVLGGSVNSRLILNLRESKGYAYYVFSQMEAFPGFGVFIIRAKVAPSFVYASVQEILNEVRANTASPLPTVEVEQAKSILIGNFPLAIERLPSFAERIAELKALNLGDDYWSRYNDNILLVNAESVFAAAQSLPLLTPVVVIAGDKNALSNQLGYFDRVDIFDAQGTFQYSLIKETDK